jgi:hypothetical protein
MKPLCIDLFCGLGGCIGFDIQRHKYKRLIQHKAAPALDRRKRPRRSTVGR